MLDKTETVPAWMQLRNSLPDQIDLAKKFAPHIRSQGENWVMECENFRIEANDAKDRNNKSILLGWMMEAIQTWYPNQRDTVGYGRWQVTGAGLSFIALGVGLQPKGTIPQS